MLSIYLQHPLQCHKAGSFLRGGKGRVVSLFSDSTGQVVGCIGTDSHVETFYFCTDEESQTRHKKRVKKEKKKREKYVESNIYKQSNYKSHCISKL